MLCPWFCLVPFPCLVPCPLPLVVSCPGFPCCPLLYLVLVPLLSCLVPCCLLSWSLSCLFSFPCPLLTQQFLHQLFFNRAEASDIQFQIGNKTIPAHSCFVGSRCPSLRKLISEQGEGEGGSKTVIPIDGVDLDVFLAFLEFLYTAHAPISPLNGVPLMLCAGRFGITRLVSLCEVPLPSLPSISPPLLPFPLLLHPFPFPLLLHLPFPSLSLHPLKVFSPSSTPPKTSSERQQKRW